jgi:hypothetical protein
MATAARRERWDHTAALCATLLNCRMGVKQSDLVSAIDLNPMRERPPLPQIHGATAERRLDALFGVPKDPHYCRPGSI